MTTPHIAPLLACSPEQVVEVARRSLARVDTPALDIFRETDLTPAWQQAFVTGRAKDPAYTRMVRLIEWLAKRHADILAAECLTSQ